MNDPITPDEREERRAQLEAELAELDAADERDAAAGDAPALETGTEADQDGGVSAGQPEPGEPEPGAPASVEAVEAARSAAPAPVEAPEPDAAPDAAASDVEPADGDGAGAGEPSEPPPGQPAEPADIAAARMAPPVPIDTRGNAE